MTTKRKYPIRVIAPLDDKNLHNYVKQVGELEQLDKDAERELVLLKDSDDENVRKKAAQKLILANLWYVIYEAKHYSGYKLPLADLIQEGNIGLMKAVKKFSPKYNVRVSSYAKLWIKCEMNEYVINYLKILRVATSKPQRKLFFNLQSNKKHLGAFTEQEIEDLANKLNVKIKEVKEMERRLSNTDLPFDSTHRAFFENVPEDEFLVPNDYLVSDGLEPYNQLLEDDTNVHIHQAMISLNARDRDIIQSRWLDDEKLTLHELSDKYDVSAERIRQLEKNAIGKIGTYMHN